MKKPRKPIRGFDRTASDMEEANRQNVIITPTLASRLGVIESLDRSISHAGVEETNLGLRRMRVMKMKTMMTAKIVVRKRLPVDDNTGHLLLPVIQQSKKVPLPLIACSHLEREGAQGEGD